MRKENRLLILAVVLLIVGITAIFIPVLTMDEEIRQDEEGYQELRIQVENKAVSMEETPEASSRPQANVVPITPSSASPTPETGKTGVDLAACKAQNEDFIAWLQIPGTPVDYPRGVHRRHKILSEPYLHGQEKLPWHAVFARQDGLSTAQPKYCDLWASYTKQ